MYFIADLEYQLMDYCLNARGAWWANHWFRNREVDDLYRRLRAKSAGEVFEILDRKSEL